MEAHRLNQELIALQNELVAAVGLPPHEHPPVTIDPLRQTIYERYGEQLREAKQIVMKAERNAATKALLNTIIKELVPADPHAAVVPAVADADAMLPHGDPAPSPVPADAAVTPARIKAAFTRGRGAGRPRADPGRQAARRPRPQGPAVDQVRGRALAPRPRLGHLPARRDPGPGDHRARHRRRRAAGRRHHGRIQQEVHARLQHAVVRRRRGPADPRARAAARSATAPWPSARSRRSCPARRVSRTRSAWSPTSSSPTARARWPRSAARRSA